MKQKKIPLVSVCIPTYNRADYLKNSIDSLITQQEFLSGDVEIVISDNASTDNTQSVGIEYSTQYPNILYFRNEENIHDANFPLALQRGNGKLLKLCNDTLLYKENALKIFCDAAEKYCDNNSEEERPFLFFSNGVCKSNESIVNFEELLNYASYWTTWIGAFSFWKNELKVFEQNNESTETRLWQVEFMCRIMERKNKAVLMSDVFCSIQTVRNKDISYGLYNVFYENYLGILTPYCNKGCFSKSCYNFLRKDLLLNFFPDWIAKWELQSNNLRYSASENLKSKIIEAYKDDSYFNEFKRKYRRTLIKEKVQKIKGKLKELFIHS